MKYSWPSLLIHLCAGAVAPLRGQTVEPPASTRPAIEFLIRQLDDQRFSVRDRATEALAALGPEALDELVHRYRSEPCHEQKLRLRYAIESVYYRKLMAGQVGFLGVQPGVLPAVWDPKTGKSVECVVVEGVIEDTAAAKGGLRPKDLILELDGRPIATFLSAPAPRAGANIPQQAGAALNPALVPRQAALEAFTSHVKMRQPGTQLSMRVLRPGLSRKVRVRIGQRPEAMNQPQALAPTLFSAGQGRSPVPGMAAGGLVIAHVPKNSWIDAAQLRVGDAIVGLDDQPVQAGATADTLDRFFKTAGPNKEVTLEVWSLEQLDLTVTLGARPPDMMNLPDWEEAQKRFAAWWRDLEGEPSLRIRKPRGYAGTGNPAVSPVPEPELVP